MMSYTYSNELAHFGIPGQKWGVRRFQNYDGTLTPEGKSRYYDSFTAYQKKVYDSMPKGRRKRLDSKLEQGMSYTKAMQSIRDENNAEVKKALKIAAGVTLTAVAGYLAYRGSTHLRDTLRKQYVGEAALRVRKANEALVGDPNSDQPWRYNKKARAIMDRGRKLADETTRRSAIGNFIKNKGKLKVSDDSFDNLVMPDTFEPWTREVANAGAGTDLILRRAR